MEIESVHYIKFRVYLEMIQSFAKLTLKSSDIEDVKRMAINCLEVVKICEDTLSEKNKL